MWVIIARGWVTLTSASLTHSRVWNNRRTSICDSVRKSHFGPEHVSSKSRAAGQIR